MAVTLNASTSTGYIQTADTSGDLALQSNGTTQFNVTSTGAYGQIKSATAVASTSGTSIDFTSIPSWVKRITIMFNGVGTNATGSSPIIVQLGDSGGIEITGYAGTSTNFTTSSLASTNITAGFGITASMLNAWLIQGVATINLVDSATNTWVSQSVTSAGGATFNNIGSGSKSLSATLDRIRITTVNGTDAFDAGSINILYEG